MGCQRFPPSFIGGCGRSGTTLVVDILGLHKEVSPIYETDFVLQLLWAQQTGEFNPRRFLSYMSEWSGRLPLRPHSKRDYEKYNHGPHYFRPTRDEVVQLSESFVMKVERGACFETEACEFVSALFAKHSTLDRKPHWINKTPLYVVALPALQRIFPDMRFVHVVRDEEATARSIVSRPWGPTTLDNARTYHKQHVAAGRRWGTANKRNYKEVEYAHLIRSPREVLVDVLEWLGVCYASYPFEMVQVRAS